jgi:hypothetical protein
LADNVVVTAGTGTIIAADELTDGTLGPCKVQYVKLMDGTLDGTTKAAVGANGLAVSATLAGTSSSFGAAFPATGLAYGITDGTNMRAVSSASALGDGLTGTSFGVTGVEVWNGAGYDKARGDTTNGLWVNVKAGGTGGSVTNAGTFAVQAASTLAAETTKVIGVTRAADGTGNLLASTGGALNVNISSGVNANGGTTSANSAPVVGADQYATYKPVAAGQTAWVLGTGATGDYLSHVTVFPGIAGCGVVTILDNATSIGSFAGGGTTALPSLAPFTIMIGAFSVSGAWKITTGASVTVAAVGKFS